MRFRFFLFLVATIVLISAGIYYSSLQKSLPVSTPGPLRKFLDQTGGQLTRAGILDETNQQRQQNNRAALRLNALLDQMATKKLQDMATQQYFEHVSPQGIGPAELAKGVGYTYLTVGENLALGNFATDTALLQAWMDSPGHRANILSTHYTEIGIATQEVTFEGRKTWLAVQEFGRPASACPTPSASLQQQFNDKKATLKTMETGLSAERKTVETLNTEEAVTNYNNKIAQAKTLAGELEKLSETINQQIRAYNTCLTQ